MTREVLSLIFVTICCGMASGTGLCTTKNVVPGGQVAPKAICEDSADVCEVYIKRNDFTTCRAFCNNYNITCSGRYDDSNNTCKRRGAKLSCEEEFGETSDDICVCGTGEGTGTSTAAPNVVCDWCAEGAAGCIAGPGCTTKFPDGTPVNETVCSTAKGQWCPASATTNNQQPTTNNHQPTTTNQQPTTNNQPTTSNQKSR
eukprot:TRINITY_DN2490_c0_g1_i3.p1 TRINITY_DN2490_c0_g1~~TRINITY_DN2490_c0_g1_i3.p1  ORF type:complete len:201 (+),score=29.64 TRINITY_DN2490_c0_g1_i3:77-679(+)